MHFELLFVGFLQVRHKSSFYILSEGDMIIRLKVKGMWKIIDDNCNIFCIITDRLNQYCKIVCKNRDKAKGESALLSLHQ
jgi:hypothetical protein